MAENLLGLYLCVEDPGGTPSFDVNDEIKVYWDDVAEDFVVYINDIEESSDSRTISPYFIIQYEDNYFDRFNVSGAYVPGGFYEDNIVSVYGYCNGTTYVSFLQKATFPYFKQVLYPDSAFCNSGACDLYVDGVIDVVDESAEGNGDGSITFNIKNTSASNVRTELSAFNYADSTNDMSESSDIWSHTYSSLSANIYTIFIVDNNGCQTSFNVEVSSKETYGELYEWEFISVDGDEHKVELLERDYSGSVTPKTQKDVIPVSISMGSSNGYVFDTIKPSSCTLSLYNLTEGEFESIVTSQDETKYLIKIYNKPSATYDLIWQGLVVPESGSESYMEVPYVSNIVATDRLADLKNTLFPDSGTTAYFNILVKCMSFLRIPNGFRLAVNLFEDSFNSDSHNDPFTQTYVDLDVYKKQGYNMDCETVVHNILKVFGARMFSYNGYWYVTRISEQGESSIAYREYDRDGLYVTNSTLSPIIDIKVSTQSSRAVWMSGATKRYSNVFKYINVISKRSINESLITPFRDEYRTDAGTDKVPSRFKGWVAKTNGATGSWLISDVTALDNVVTSLRHKEGSREPRGDRAIEREVVQGARSTRGGSSSFSIRREIRGADLFTAEYLDNGYLYRSDFNDGSTNEAYLKYKTNVEYSNNDTFQLKIPYKAFVQFSIVELPNPYIVLNWSLKVGSNYLVTDGTWSSTEVINEFWVTNYNKNEEVTITSSFNDVTGSSSTTLELKVYDISWKYRDDSFSNEAALIAAVAAIDITSLGSGSRRIYHRDDNSTLYFYELRRTSGDNDGLQVIESDTSNYIWVLLGVSETTNNYKTFIEYRDIYFMTFPNNLPIEGQEVINTSGGNNVNNMDYDLIHFDLNTSINNSENIITNYIKKAGQLPTTSWGGSKIQEVLLNTLSLQFGTTRTIINGTLKSDVDVPFYSVFRDTLDSNKIYLINSITLDLKSKQHQVEIHEINGDVNAITKAYSSGYSSGYS